MSANTRKRISGFASSIASSHLFLLQNIFLNLSSFTKNRRRAAHV